MAHAACLSKDLPCGVEVLAEGRRCLSGEIRHCPLPLRKAVKQHYRLSVGLQLLVQVLIIEAVIVRAL